MKPFTSRQYSLRNSICLSTMLALAGLSLAASNRKANAQDPEKPALAPSGSAAPSGSKLTPEERSERKQARLKKEMEQEQKRIETFGVIPEEDTSPLAAAYREAVREFRIATAEFADAQARLQFRLDPNVPDSDRYKWLQKLQNNFEKLVAFRNAAADLVMSNPAKYENVALMLREMLIADVTADRLDHWTKGARAILACESLITDDVLFNAGYVGFSSCDFELAVASWSKLAKEGKLGEIELHMLQEIPNVAHAWEKERARREEDANKDNPRVEFLTTKGIVEVELFEDDAPETVASFIYLVENGYYNRKPIFLVKRHWLAQTGCEKGDGKGTAGYTIPFEGDRPTHRDHFRGSLAVPLGINTETQVIDPNSGGAQFYFSFLPVPIFDGKHTVFGRIVRGQEALGMFKEVNLTEEEQRKDQSLRPDSIVTAKVIKKRDHPYRPTPVLGKLPR